MTEPSTTKRASAGYSTRFQPRAARAEDAAAEAPRPDARDGSTYVWTEEIVLTVQIAQATGRPLLISGPPGCGKSSLAAFIARSMGWNYFEQVITSRTRAQDLQWRFDAVRRLRDAHASDGQGRSRPSDVGEAYLDPQALWWGIDPAGAERRGLDKQDAERLPKPAPPGLLRGTERPSVVLLDEIDKADPDVPNDLLVGLGSLQFQVVDTGTRVALPPGATPPLVLITSNNERTLPKAFLRRCVTLQLRLPSTPEAFIAVAEAHFPNPDGPRADLFQSLADRFVALQAEPRDEDVALPGTAEYLDAVRACVDFGILPNDQDPKWRAIELAVLRKRQAP